MSVHDLLPPNSTQFERDLVRSRNFLPTLAPATEGIRTAKVIELPVPPSVQPWLVYELGLSEITSYHPDLLTAIREGVEWQWIKGTPQSILTALGWIDCAPIIDEAEERNSTFWADYHLGFEPQPPDESDLADIAFLARISNPARTRAQRFYSNWDFRLLRWDEDVDGWSQGRMWSDHSGIRGVAGVEGTQISLMRIFHGSCVSLDPEAGGLQIDRHFGANGVAWLWEWSETGIYSDQWHALNMPQIRQDVHVAWDLQPTTEGWPSFWPEEWTVAGRSSGGVFLWL
jgi:hypothetical protein